MHCQSSMQQRLEIIEVIQQPLQYPVGDVGHGNSLAQIEGDGLFSIDNEKLSQGMAWGN